MQLNPAQETIIKKVLWSRGELSWKLHSTQLKIDEVFKKLDAQLFVGNCSRQLGKSYWAVTVAVSFAIKYPKSQIRYGAAFWTDLSEFIIPAFDKVMDDCPSHIKGKYKSQGSKYIFPNGSSIKLVGLDKNPNALRGNTLDLIILDEVGFVTKLDYIYKSVIIPATTHRPNCKIIMISTPPESPAHEFIQYVQKAEYEGGYAKFTIYDNPMLTQEDIERLAKEVGGIESVEFKREYLCEFIIDKDKAIIPEFNDKYVQQVERQDVFKFYHKYTAMDLGVRDFTAVLFGYYDFLNAQLIIEDEFIMNGPDMTTDKLAQEITDKESELKYTSIYSRIADNNNLLLLQDLGINHKLYFSATNKDSLAAMVNELRLWVKKGRIVINPKCKQLIGCLKYGLWNKDRSEFARTKIYGHFDALASLIYLVRNIDQTTNPIPTTYGYDTQNTHFPEQQNPKKSEWNKAIK